MSFIVRIELNSSIGSDFSILHQAMNSNGFSQTMVFDSGKEYYLPKATYKIKKSSYTVSEILALSKQAVAQTGKTAEILVVEYTSCAVSGLTPVK